MEVIENQFSDAEENISQTTKQTFSLAKDIKSLSVHYDNNIQGYGSNDDYDDDDDDDDDDEYYSYRRDHTVNKENVINKTKSTLQPQEKQFGKFVNKISVEKYEGPSSLHGRAANHLHETAKKQHAQTVRVKDRKDRATVEQVLDPRTKMILFKLLNKGVISEINGCISTGKEANVYHASTPSGINRAVKIYKTSILIFKDRDKYVSGEFRFRHGYCKGNPRKMVRTWAEKEMRNLTRLCGAGIPCPEPIILRSHVLVMDFIGHDGFPAPLLKDANISESKARELYLRCVRIMRDMYWKARLVHADFSEFNILYNAPENLMYVIDVSQSVEHDHPSSLLFLRKDCTNINEFFRKHGVNVMTVKELFDFVTDPLINEDNIEQYLETLQEVSSKRSIEDVVHNVVEEEVFKNAYIPQRLDEVIDYERDTRAAKQGSDQFYYANLTGLNKELSGAKSQPDLIENSSTNNVHPSNLVETSSDSESDSNSESSEEESFNKNPEDAIENAKNRKIMRKENKKLVKDQNREKRKDKVPKHVKKRCERLGKVK
ncbi:serine/threonine-protein kinase RIO1 isoform X1 [Hydra vulgaris]|uniref:Serine/threonine-protein kinase RIO1 n=1 Tax=Hydra vulgaris TaxID=6087 RepID=T2M723_HYDVU|nr:serine/threonine-protein kinase RIO1 [Hydra vulgaris]